MILRCLGAHCAPLRDNIANGNISLQTVRAGRFHHRTTVLSFGLGVCLPGRAIAAHGRTATRLPTRPVVDSLCCGKATPVETCHWHVSKSRLSNPFHLTPKKNRYSNEYRFFWWKVVDSNHRSHRRQIYSLFPLATRETFRIQLAERVELVDGLEPPTC